MRAIELVRRLKASCSRDDEKFALFFGAGCSVSSGIPICSTLIEKDWLPKLYEIEKENEPYGEWLRKQKESFNSGNSADLYSNVISRLFHYPQERQHEIERICKDALPGFGYGVLSMLVSQEKDKFNVIATTNFDNLIADAMYLFSNYHSLVISHESLAEFIRPTTSKPIILKLHHDAQLAPCNTSDEVSEIAPEMVEKFQSLMYDRGLIFIGYGGNDTGIYKLLDSLPQIALPYGVYWINGEEPNSIIRPWLEERRAFWINQLDFDEFMLIVKHEFDLDNPDREHVSEVFDNYYAKLETLGKLIEARDSSTQETKILDEALKSTIDGIKDPNGYYLKALKYEEFQPDLAKEIYLEGLNKYPLSANLLCKYADFLSKSFNDYSNAAIYYEKALNIEPDNPYYAIDLAGLYRYHLNNYDIAEKYYKLALEKRPSTSLFLGFYADFLFECRGDIDQAEKLYKQAFAIDKNNSFNLGNYAALLIKSRNDYDEAEKCYELALKIDPKDPYINVNYADFLCEIRQNLDLAEDYYKRAYESKPKDEYYKNKFIQFIREKRKDSKRADKIANEN